MKQRDFLLGLCMISGGFAFAASPYTGTTPEEAFAKGGKYYLYQVETGTWLQTNRNDNGGASWTTHAELGGIGLDIELRRPNESFTEGYQIFCNFTNNGELNGSDQDRFFFDQGDRMLTEWIFEPVEGGYKIMVKARDVAENRQERDGVAEDRYIGSNESNTWGGLSDDPTVTTWQLVSREERIEKMKAEAAKNGSADATFLLPWNERGRNDLRDREWTVNDVNAYGGGMGLDGSQWYPVIERWHQISHKASITLTDIPNGTYSFAVQGYYRDGSIEDEGVRQRGNAGTSELLAEYFIGTEVGKIKSIFADAKSEWQPGFEYETILLDEDLIETGRVWTPNSMTNATVAFHSTDNVDVMSMSTPYMNDWISAGVPDGTLTLGVQKLDTEHYRDWFIYKRMFLRYDGEQVKGEDISGLQADLRKLIDEAKGLYQSESMKASIAEAQNTLDTATGSSALIQAIDKLQAAVNAMKDSQGVIDNYLATLKFYKDAEAQEKFDAAAKRSDYENALKTLRFARRRAAREQVEDVFEGVTVDKLVNGGEYYLYNVGQRQFFSGGSDWGAHAALANPGIVLTLEADEGMDDNNFFIHTGLKNGDQDGYDKAYLNYRGYCDCARVDDFYFQPVEGKPGVYNILQNDYRDVHMAWNPWASVDQHMGDETTVGTECRDLDPEDLNAQWKVISVEEREKAIAGASLEHPVDASFLINNPGFNQRQSDEGWSSTGDWAGDKRGSGIWGRGSNYNDFAYEYWNAVNCDLNQMIDYDFPAGIYCFEVQGIYRNGSHNAQATYRNDDADNHLAGIYVGAEEALLPNIMEAMDMCPGEGSMAYDITYEQDGDDLKEVSREAIGEWGEYVNHLEAWFHAGFYKTRIVFEHNGGEIFVGAFKDDQANEEDWVVVDNFRIKYFGNNTTVQEVEGATSIEEIAVEEAPVVKDNRIFNLMGIEVKNPTVPGIYIQNGKKFIVR
ncbi:MAG: hypothetical protein NC336_02990 [Clostridium sp.]|nr:hypothetical protein [Clostridium sp.]